MMNEINVKEAPVSAESINSKKVKISQFSLLKERVKELSVKDEVKEAGIESSWDLVNFKDGLISAYNDSKRIRVAGDAEKRAEAKWDSYRQLNVYDKSLDSDDSVANEISSDEESFDTVNTPEASIPTDLEEYSKIFAEAIQENVKPVEENVDIPVYSSEPEKFNSVPDFNVDFENEETFNNDVEENDFSKRIEEQVHLALQDLDLSKENDEEVSKVEEKKEETSANEKSEISDSISELEQLKKQYLESLKLYAQAEERIAAKEKNIEKKENCIKSLQTGTIAFYKAGIEKLNSSLEQKTAKDDYLTGVDKEVTAKLMDADAAYWEAKNHTEENSMVDESVARKIA